MLADMESAANSYINNPEDRTAASTNVECTTSDDQSSGTSFKSKLTAATELDLISTGHLLLKET